MEGPHGHYTWDFVSIKLPSLFFSERSQGCCLSLSLLDYSPFAQINVFGGCCYSLPQTKPFLWIQNLMVLFHDNHLGCPYCQVSCEICIPVSLGKLEGGLRRAELLMCSLSLGRRGNLKGSRYLCTASAQRTDQQLSYEEPRETPKIRLKITEKPSKDLSDHTPLWSWNPQFKSSQIVEQQLHQQQPSVQRNRKVWPTLRRTEQAAETEAEGAPMSCLADRRYDYLQRIKGNYDDSGSENRKSLQRNRNY